MAARGGGHAGGAGATPDLAARDGGHAGGAGATPDLAAGEGGHAGDFRDVGDRTPSGTAANGTGLGSLLHSEYAARLSSSGAGHGTATPGGQTPAALRWASGAATDQGRVRSVNQDAYLDRPDLGLWAVADGMGGHTDGALASRTIVAALGRIPHSTRLGSAARAIRTTVQSVNQQLLDQAATLPAGDLIGSTAVVMVAVGRHCAILWVGDSRAYRLRDGVLAQLTIDHSQVQAMVDAGLLSPERAEEHPQSNVLLRAVGSDTVLEVDGSIQRLRAGDRYLLCSDGLYRELDPRTMATILANLAPGEGAQLLVQRACEAGGRDNVSAVVVDFLAPRD